MMTRAQLRCSRCSAAFDAGTTFLAHSLLAVHLLIQEGLAATGHILPELHHALGALARCCQLRFAADAHTPDHPPMPAHPVLQQALTLAATTYPQLRSAADLAHRVGLSPARLWTLFREAGRESPSAMIWRLKVQRAIQLIRSTGLTLGEIADDCGYANPFHLSRSVRRHTGSSPRQLRQAEWKTAARGPRRMPR
jgi:AraC-like DNA-binding protein